MLSIPGDDARDPAQHRLGLLVEYDRRRGTQLLDTLEGYLDHHGNVVGTSRALFIHPNTLRQRLDRIQHESGIDLEHEDWLSLAVATKVVKLARMRGSAGREGGRMADTAPRSVEDVRKLVDKMGIEFVFAQFVEMYGKPNAKLVPANHLEDVFAEGAGFAGFAAGEIGQGPHSPDLAAMPDPASFTPVPWQPNLARFACDVYVEGEPWPYCPRTILKRQLERARKMGFTFKTGMEVEFFLLRRNADGRIELADQLDTLDRPCYDMKALSRQFDFISTLSKYESQLGWDNYANDHEDANGQFESNFQYADALTTADRVIFHRYMLHSLAQMRGLEATVMPKPFANLTGNGLHCHMSLWDAKKDTPLFEDAKDSMGLSKLAYHFLGGLLKHAKAYIGITASTVNSYKRLIVGAPTSGATWSPVYVTYGGNNRTQMIRVPAGGRFEDRTIDGAANPYLAATAILAAGLDGIENEHRPWRAEHGEPLRGIREGPQEAEDRHPARQPLGRRAEPPSGQGAPRRVRQDPRRRLPRLLLRREGAGVEGLPRPRQRLGGGQVPGPVLGDTRPGSPPGRATETSASGADELWSNPTPRSAGSGLVSTGTPGVPFARKGPDRI